MLPPEFKVIPADLFQVDPDARALAKALIKNRTDGMNEDSILSALRDLYFRQGVAIFSPRGPVSIVTDHISETDACGEVGVPEGWELVQCKQYKTAADETAVVTEFNTPNDRMAFVNVVDHHFQVALEMPRDGDLKWFRSIARTIADTIEL